MKDYKRLTFKRLVDPYDNDCEENENASAASYEELLNRLAELEDKIEDGTLVEIESPCTEEELERELIDIEAYKKGCKETAEKIFKMLISKLESNQFLSGERIIMEVDVENLAKQFDVEIEEL